MLSKKSMATQTHSIRGASEMTHQLVRLRVVLPPMPMSGQSLGWFPIP